MKLGKTELSFLFKSPRTFIIDRESNSIPSFSALSIFDSILYFSDEIVKNISKQRIVIPILIIVVKNFIFISYLSLKINIVKITNTSARKK